MRTPGFPSFIFLLLVLVGLPLSAIRTRRRLRPAGATHPGEPKKPPPSRRQVLIFTPVHLTLLGFIAWFFGSTFGYNPFAPPSVLRAGDLAAGLMALAVLGGIRWAVHRWLSSAEQRSLPILRWLPRTAGERALFVLGAVLAGLAEEAAYRGVTVAILRWMLGSLALAWLIAAAAFAVAHAVQGWKAGVAIFFIALTLHGLVWFTGTLVVAMAVHAVYDIVVGIVAGNRAKRLDAA
jgi:hypothetical protein